MNIYVQYLLGLVIVTFTEYWLARLVFALALFSSPFATLGIILTWLVMGAIAIAFILKPLEGTN